MTGKGPDLGRRLASLGALLALAGALAAAGFAIASGELWRIPIALAALVILVVGLWYALSRRGAARAAGLLVAAASLAGFVAVTVTSAHRAVVFLVGLVLLASSAAAARYALAPTTTAPPPATEAPAVARPTGHAVLLMNPRSGGGKVVSHHLVDECCARAIEPVVLEPGDDLSELAVRAVARGADVIGMAGGDGSQALVAAVAARHDLAYVCVPAGTRNHFALDLGLDRNDVVGALDAFADGIERRIDLASVNGRIFVNNACMGLYAKIVQSRAYREAKLKTAAEMLPDMIGPDAEPFDLRFVGPDGGRVASAHLLLVSNDPYELEQLAGKGSRPRLDLGTLGVAAASISSSAEAVQFAGLEAAGRIRRFKGWQEWEASRFEVDSGAAIEIGIDGEALTMEPPLVFESLAGALRVRLPRHATGLAPAARARRLGASTVGELVRTTAGRPSS